MNQHSDSIDVTVAGDSTNHNARLASNKEIFAHLRILLRAIPRARTYSMCSLVLLAIASWCMVSIPAHMGQMVDIIQADDASTAIWHECARMLTMAITSGLLFALGIYLLSAKVSEVLLASLRVTMVNTTLELPLHQIEDAGTGDLVSRSTDDVAELSTALDETLPVLGLSTFTLGAAIIAFSKINPWFLIVVAVIAPIAWLAGKQYVSQAPTRYAAERAAMGQRARSLLEAIQGAETVRAFQLQERTGKQLEQASKAVVANGLQARMLMITLNAHMALARTTAVLTALAIGYWQVQAHDLSTGAVTTALLLIIQIFGPFMMLMRSLDTVQSGWASLARIVGISATMQPPALDYLENTPEKRGHIQFEHVNFSYDAQHPILQDVCFEVAPGGSLALVGPTGAGKSTIAALIAGIRLPDSGQVLIDGHPIHQYRDSQRYGRIALISQEVHIFSGNLREDLLLAKPQATDEEIHAALQLAGLETWIAGLADGLDTKVGAGGMSLEPVRGQQLAIARIALFDPAIVIMDEATAEAGSQHAAALEAAAARLQENRTVVLVAHRLDQAAQADVILVINNGHIAEAGSHQELLAENGAYAHMWQAWQAGKSTE
ncbi:MAG: ABC transporter ATP-binding protein [Corynebacterium sp.]|nr:ABC transporter ATP-binding protein [Corynebacterium sp.]